MKNENCNASYPNELKGLPLWTTPGEDINRQMEKAKLVQEAKEIRQNYAFSRKSVLGKSEDTEVEYLKEEKYLKLQKEFVEVNQKWIDKVKEMEKSYTKIMKLRQDEIEQALEGGYQEAWEMLQEERAKTTVATNKIVELEKELREYKKNNEHPGRPYMENG